MEGGREKGSREVRGELALNVIRSEGAGEGWLVGENMARGPNREGIRGRGCFWRLGFGVGKRAADDGLSRLRRGWCSGDVLCDVTRQA